MSLQVTGLHVGYATAGVLHGVDFEIGDAQSVALLGRNGMGKTTLVRAICGLRPPTVTAGSIVFNGTELTKLPVHRIARAGIALVPQGRRVFGSLTTLENLTVVPRRRRADAADPWSVERVFDFFPRLAERSGSMARSLSGGEQQMLAIGRALMTNPSLLIMDEPSEGLAPSVLDVIQDRLEGLRASGLSILIAEQNVDLALDIAERVIVIDDSGTIAWSGTPAELRADDVLLERHLSI
ncbi:MAG: ABC transporter ATP-binding protein [Candidatus Microbacterium phytovorans]|uniref:ABC transporter ATP-binding protein n=1 Tax=Candidatus Microbacterium phytovorans TaxID=3121374 RepID=A0AAJ5VZG7_9MICO|nr:ABC transporter ATP-binding protein [Microbacterium sp.]WEK12284.1 MAG: ABC transporter ATP-binding protein [Microbacterium sp.]